MASQGATLSVQGVTVRFGGVTANSDVTMKAEPGQITALIGPNGAGKTTLINAVTGFVRASGTIHIGDQSLTGLPPHTRRRLGLARTWQAGELFDALSILDNVRKGHWHDHKVSSGSARSPTRAASQAGESTDRERGSPTTEGGQHSRGETSGEEACRVRAHAVRRECLQCPLFCAIPRPLMTGGCLLGCSV